MSANFENVEINTICRSCLDLNGPFQSIYDGSDGSCLAYVFISNFTGIKPKHSDGLPDKVCLSCIREIECCYAFWCKCEKSDQMLRQLHLNAVSEEQRPTSNAMRNNIVEQVETQKKFAILEQETPNNIKENINSQVCFDAEIPVENTAPQVPFTRLEQQRLTQSTNVRETSPIQTVDQKESTSFDDANKASSKSIECEKTFNSKRSLCAFCGQTFSSKFALERHGRRFIACSGNGTSSKPVKAQVDHNKTHNEASSMRSSLKRTMETENKNGTKETEEHAGTKQQREKKPMSSLQENGANSIEKTKSKLHSIRKDAKPKHRSKLSKKLYKCDQCSYKSTEYSTLQIHIRIHAKLKPFQCNKCDYTCKLYQDLQNHMKTHAEAFQCSTCHESLLQKSELKAHQIKHNTEPEFQCDICGTTYLNRSTFRKHCARHHRKDDDNIIISYTALSDDDIMPDENVQVQQCSGEEQILKAKEVPEETEFQCTQVQVAEVDIKFDAEEEQAYNAAK